MPADYHTHTPFCLHAKGEPEAYVEQALRAGITEYGISDHAPQQPEPFDDWRMLDAQIPEYLEWIERAKQHAGRRLSIRSSLECDWISGGEAWLEHLTSRHDWDYLIGAVHYLGDWDMDNPKWLGRWAKCDLEDVWTRYWKTYTEMVESGFFDIFAHPDLVKKFSFFPNGDLDRFYEPVIDAIASSGGVIELNTAGWHKQCAEAYPAPRFLELACSAGIGLVISSDAHRPEDVGRNFDQAIALAKASGFRETVLFEKRQRSTEPLP